MSISTNTHNSALTDRSLYVYLFLSHIYTVLLKPAPWVLADCAAKSRKVEKLKSVGCVFPSVEKSKNRKLFDF